MRPALLLLLPLFLAACTTTELKQEKPGLPVRTDEARSAVRNVRDYALANLPELTLEETRFITTTDPEIGHANGIVYYYYWRFEPTGTIFVVETSPPPFTPHLAARAAME
jgi:hypothetical protein